MKKTGVIRIIIILLLIFSACFFSQKIYAAEISINKNTSPNTIVTALEKGDTIKFDYPEIGMNKYVYCLQKDKSITYGQNKYKKDTTYKNTVTLPSRTSRL